MHGQGPSVGGLLAKQVAESVSREGIALCIISCKIANDYCIIVELRLILKRGLKSKF